MELQNSHIIIYSNKCLKCTLYIYKVVTATGSATDITEDELSSKMSEVSTADALTNGMRSSAGDASDWLSQSANVTADLKFDTSDDGLYFQKKYYSNTFNT